MNLFFIRKHLILWIIHAVEGNIFEQPAAPNIKIFEAPRSSAQMLFSSPDMWALLFKQLPIENWQSTALTCKAANDGLRLMMMISFGHKNTWANKYPSYAHNWKCRHHPNGPMNAINVPYPCAFSNPASTFLRQFTVASESQHNLDNAHGNWHWDFEFIPPSLMPDRYTAIEEEEEWIENY